jgi:transcription termination factor Rho
MSVLTRSSLEGSPLADLHELASELELDGFRRLRKADLVDRILEVHGGDTSPAPEADAEAEPEAAPEPQAAAEEKPRRSRSRSRRTPRDSDSAPDTEAEAEEPAGEKPARAPRPDQASVEGTVELLANGSGFVRVNPPDASDDDVYISAAQIRRCELVAGDKVSGPVRRPRRSERYPSLVRVDTINGKAADEVAEGTHFDDLPCGFAADRFALGDSDPTLKAIEFLTPIGRGSRVTITGPSRSGKSFALRLLARALAETDGIELSVVLSGARPEEAAEWSSGEGAQPSSVASMSSSSDAQAQAIERCVETAKRIAARGGHAVVLIDSLDGMPVAAARRTLAAARAITDGGSLTIVAVSTVPVGGETTVIALDLALASTNRFPAIDILASGTLRPELLVGEGGAEAVAKARAEVLGL